MSADESERQRISEIRSILSGIEHDHAVRVLYAVESGSRAWGFASRDSDWDVRFIYCHPLPWYLSLRNRRDVIELPIQDDLDINGWDLRKALRLMQKSNPVLYEWLASPITYRENAAAMQRFRAVAQPFFSQVTAAHHYLHMAEGNFREYLRGEEVWLKKYFYVLRPVLAGRWVLAGRGQPPVRFDDLVAGVVTDPDVLREIECLLAAKRDGDELRRGPTLPAIHRFLEAEIPLQQALLADVRRQRLPEECYAAADGFFREAIGNAARARPVEDGRWMG